MPRPCEAKDTVTTDTECDHSEHKRTKWLLEQFTQRLVQPPGFIGVMGPSRPQNEAADSKEG